MIVHFNGLKLDRPKKIEKHNIKQPIMILKTVLNFSGVEVLSREEQMNIVGKGDPYQVGQCAVYAPYGSNPADYPEYPCVGPEPICRIKIDGSIEC